MSKVITFSRVFPAYHPKKGEPTYFVEAILTQLGIKYKTGNYYIWLKENNPEISDVFLMKFFYSLNRDIYPKSHTIRNHKKPVKVGDFINPKCWAGKPYNKTVEGFWQIKFAPDIEIKKIWEVAIATSFTDESAMLIRIENKLLGTDESVDFLAQNDGLDHEELFYWFWNKKDNIFKGQIICWNENINY